VSPVKYELGFYIPEDDIRHSHCRENLKSYTTNPVFRFCFLEKKVYPVMGTCTINITGMSVLIAHSDSLCDYLQLYCRN
jgi:hypothetical protein